MQICETSKWLSLFAKAKSIATVLEQKLVQLRKKSVLLNLFDLQSKFVLNTAAKNHREK